jgi:dTDP-4-amino-4,6-dideoxygalactose transaminase
MKIPFNKPAVLGEELGHIERVLKKRELSGDGEYAKRCADILEKRFKIPRALLTNSGTSALDLSAMLLDLKEGDEVIASSYTFPSTVNAFMLRGAKPVFVDIREDTLNIDEKLIEEKITARTKAAFLTHYAGIGCALDKIKKIAGKYDLFVVEDAALGINAKFKDTYLGTAGHLGVYSFHESKNITCGEGGTLLINDKRFIERAEIIRERGTDRSKFLRGETDRYTWVDIGSSSLLSEISAAYLYVQLQHIDTIQKKRKRVYDYYVKNLKGLEAQGKVRLPVIPAECTANYHMFYLLLPDGRARDGLMRYLEGKGIRAVFHYLPLHLSPMGRKMGYRRGDLPLTEALSGRLLRLPLYGTLSSGEQQYIVKHIKRYSESIKKRKS